MAQAKSKPSNHLCSLDDLDGRERVNVPVNFNSSMSNSAQGPKPITSHLIRTGLVTQNSIATEQLYGSLLMSQGLAAVGGACSDFYCITSMCQTLSKPTQENKEKSLFVDRLSDPQAMPLQNPYPSSQRRVRFDPSLGTSQLKTSGCH